MLNERRKNIVVPVVLLLGIFIGGVIVLRTQGIGAQVLTEGKKVLFPIASEPDADPDNDGLKNWEEEIYKTDPRNPDTDGDGYLDGEEVASGYDPTIKAPNDALEGTDTNAPRQAPKNLTTYLAQILTQKISSGEIDPSSLKKTDALNDPTIPYNKEVLNEALAQIGRRANEYFVLPQIQDEDIKISRVPTTREEVAQYVVAISGAIKTSDELASLNKSEMAIIQDAIENNNVGRVTILLNAVKQNIFAVKNVVTPKDFADLHKKQIAILLLDEKILEAVKDFQGDPATAIAGLETYPKMSEIIDQFSNELTSRLNAYSL